MRKNCNRNFALIFIIVLLIAALPIFKGSGEPATAMKVEPETIVDLSLTPDSSFNVNVTVSDVTNLWGYTVRLGYNKDILTATNYTSLDPFTQPYPSLMDDSGIDRLRPDGQGTYANWTGTFANWDEDTPDGDATYVSAASTNRNQTSRLSSTRFLPTWVTIQKVKVVFVARQTTGDEKVMPLIFFGGKLYNGSAFTPSTTYSEFSGEWLTNPATGSAWTSAEISDLQAGVRSEQNGPAWDGEVRVTQLYVEVYHNFGALAITRSMSLGTAFGVNGTFQLVRITFKVDALGLTALDLYQTLLSTPTAGVITHEDIDGSFTNIFIHDVVVKSVTPTKYRIPEAGELISINVNVTNEGDFDEAFFVTLTFNGTLIDNQTDISLRIDESTSLTFNWDTSGIAHGEYILRAQVGLATDNRPNNNILDVKFRVGVIRDIAIESITLNTPEAYVGESVLITVIVKNQGNFSESFSITVKYDNTTIETRQINNLPVTSQTLVFNWQTGAAPEGTYIISCEAVLAVDDDLSNNRMESTQIKLGPGGYPVVWLYAGYALIAIIIVLIALYIINRRRKRKKQPQPL